MTEYASKKQTAFMREHGLRSIERLQWFSNEYGYNKREVELALVNQLMQMFRFFIRFLKKHNLHDFN